MLTRQNFNAEAEEGGATMGQGSKQDTSQTEQKKRKSMKEIYELSKTSRNGLVLRKSY